MTNWMRSFQRFEKGCCCSDNPSNNSYNKYLYSSSTNIEGFIAQLSPDNRLRVDNSRGVARQP